MFSSILADWSPPPTRAFLPPPEPPRWPHRPPFEDAVRYWRSHLEILRPREELRWVFRENLRPGGARPDRGTATVTIDPTAPSYDARDAAAVYARANATGVDPLCFELVYAAPDRTYATLRHGSGPEPFELEPEGWDLTFQLAPSFHAVDEVRSPSARPALRDTPDNDDALLTGILRGDRTTC